MPDRIFACILVSASPQPLGAQGEIASRRLAEPEVCCTRASEPGRRVPPLPAVASRPVRLPFGMAVVLG